MTADILMNEFMNLEVSERTYFMKSIGDILKSATGEVEETNKLAAVLKGIKDVISEAVAMLILNENADSDGITRIVVPEFLESTPVGSEEELIDRLNCLTWYRFKNGREMCRLFDYFIICDGMVDIQVSPNAKAILSDVRNFDTAA